MAMAALMAPLLRRLARPPQALAPPQHARSVVTIKKFTADRARRHVKEPKPALLETKGGGSAPFSPSIEPNSGDDKAPERAVVRLAKRIAMSGLCSRREAEKLIQKRQVTVNGKVASELGTNVHVLGDQVAVDGKLLPRAAHGDKPLRTKVWMANKLKGELVTANDPQGRATIFDRLRVMGLTQHMMPVGRLDFNTEGLLLFTNDGDYARQLEHPKSDITRVYRVLVRGNVSESKLLELRRGPTIDGIKYRSIHATVQSTDKKDSWLQVRITEGKNREIRKALAHVRLVVKQLVRVQYGPYRLADLPAGAVLAVRPKLLDESRTKLTKKPKKDKPTKEEEVDSA